MCGFIISRICFSSITCLLYFLRFSGTIKLVYYFILLPANSKFCRANEFEIEVVISISFYTTSVFVFALSHSPVYTSNLVATCISAASQQLLALSWLSFYGVAEFWSSTGRGNCYD